VADVVAPRPLVPLPARLAVFLSGRGSNFESLADACERGDVPARIVAVVSDRAEAEGLKRAERRGVTAYAAERKLFPDRPAHEARLAGIVEAEKADLICLAGFMRVLSKGFVQRFPLRILNVHPSLLPSFQGLDAQGQALRYGARVAGATIHFVDAGVDTGPIVLQEAVPVLAGDDEASLTARILEVEHRLYPQAVRTVLEGGWSLSGRAIRLDAER